MKRIATGTWCPAWVPESTKLLASILLVCSMAQSATGSSTRQHDMTGDF